MPSELAGPMLSGGAAYPSGNSSLEIRGYGQNPSSGQSHGYGRHHTRAININQPMSPVHYADPSSYYATCGIQLTGGDRHESAGYVQGLEFDNYQYTNNDNILRSAIAQAPFDWTTMDAIDKENSGSTSPGSTRMW